MAPASALVFPSASVPHLANPEWFSGASGKCRAFLVQCGLHFELQASSFPIKQAKGAFMIGQGTTQYVTHWLCFLVGQEVGPGLDTIAQA